MIFHFSQNPRFWQFSGVLEVKFKFQYKFYDIFDHDNKCPSSETEDAFLENHTFTENNLIVACDSGFDSENH